MLKSREGTLSKLIIVRVSKAKRSAVSGICLLSTYFEKVKIGSLPVNDFYGTWFPIFELVERYIIQPRQMCSEWLYIAIFTFKTLSRAKTCHTP